MATPIKNNLPPGSQQWVRDVEQRLISLERDNQLLQVTANQNAAQIGSIMTALGSIPRSAGASGEWVGSGSMTLTARVDVPSNIGLFTVLAIGTVTPRREGPGGTVVDGTGLLSTTTNNYTLESNVIAPVVTSDPSQQNSSSAISSSSGVNQDNDTTYVEASFTATYSFGSPGAGGGFAALTLIVLPQSRSN